MRPVRLYAEGFTAFREAIDVDFRTADYFALVGPTGAGKSSVLDAICFALYGIVPRYNDERAVAPAITQGAAEAKVSLTFEIDGIEHIATRVARRTKTGATTKEARLERGSEVLAGDVKAMGSAIADLIGLNFAQFTRCVLLPQGEFARFLHDTPGDRQDLLVRLLDLGVYTLMQSRASELAREHKQAHDLTQQRLGDFAQCTAERLDEARAALDVTRAFRDHLREHVPHIAQLDRAVVTAVEHAAQIRESVTRLEAVRVPPEIDQLGSQRTAGLARISIIDRDLATEAAEIDRLEPVLAAAPDGARLQRHLELHERRETLDAELGVLATQLATAESDQAAAAATCDRAVAAAIEAQRAHDHTAAHAGALELAATLEVGAPCPVCRQVVSSLPQVEPGALQRVRELLDQARAAETTARARRSDADALVHSERGRHAATIEQRDAVMRELEGVDPPESLRASLAHIAAQRSELEQRRRAVREHTQQRNEAVAYIASIDRDLAGARDVCGSQRDALVAVGLAPPPIGDDLVGAWQGLATWAAAQTPARRHDAETAQVAEAAAIDAARSARASLVQHAIQSGFELADPEPDIDQLREIAAAREQRAAEAAERIEAGLAEIESLQARIAQSRDDHEVAAELARLLKSNGFEKWLVNEALQRLVVGASATLEDLSGGHYGLAVDDRNDFEVVDHRNADERRPARTLSGGETFQASLALSLALADEVGAMAAGGVAKLDAIFLDEGFGTLDPDSLDVVATTLESLGSRGRMVGVVTHVRELAERVPVRFEVVQTARTSTVTRVEA